MGQRRINYEEWLKEAKQLYGEDPLEWSFKCPVCGYEASVRDWKEAGATSGEAGFSCIGRHMTESRSLGEEGQPCDYAGGGLFRLNPVTVVTEDGTEVEVFEFADA